MVPNKGAVRKLLARPPDLRDHIIRRLQTQSRSGLVLPKRISAALDAAVLFILGLDPQSPRPTPCLILNKRSAKVKQGGDLCCPGGGIHLRADLILSKLLYLPLSPLQRWPCWSTWRRASPKKAALLARILATALREGIEEMHLNPFGIQFLGPLPAQSLVMFSRNIFPMASWTNNQRGFRPNWEVDKIVRIPLQDLLNPDAYARYRFRFREGVQAGPGGWSPVHPCFIHADPDGSEILWGATYRITMSFLELVFGFTPPDPDALPLVERTLDATYLTGIPD